MATKSISISEEAYRRLASLRQGRESFSEIINRLTRKRQLMEFAGLLSIESSAQMKKHIRGRRAALDKELERRRKKISEELA